MLYNLAKSLKMKLSYLKKIIDEQYWTDFGIVDIKSVQGALAEHEGVFEEWLEKGYAANMSYLKRMQNDRFHPQNKLPDVKSVIVLLAWYSSSGGGYDSGPGVRPNRGKESTIRSKNWPITGKVARYAVGRDYHKVLKKKLIQLSNQLKIQVPGLETYASVDSGPTVDRVLAQVAGLGFFGKNSMIISPKRGSYFFIASLMVNQELPVTKKQQMPNCGTCNKCMVACPTDAIVAPGVIDARRCISYLTIENKGGIPVEFRRAVGNRLFGCDICQEVCPFNIGRAGQQQVRIQEIKMDQGGGFSLDLREILAIETDEQFLQKFAGTPFMRAKRWGLLRNACVVAGNSGDVSLIADLEVVIDREQDEMLKEHARWAIDELRRV